MLSGYGELSKQAILAGENQWKKFVSDFGSQKNISALVQSAVAFKLKITDADVRDDGNRKQLNFGHTVGHAFESYFLKINKPMPHGICVAAGMICELRLSEMIFKCEGLFKNEIEFLKKNFPKLKIGKAEVKEFLLLIFSDKKNQGKRIKPVLLKSVGASFWNNEVSIGQIEECIHFYRN